MRLGGCPAWEKAGELLLPRCGRAVVAELCGRAVVAELCGRALVAAKVGPFGFIFTTRISEILHPLTCSCEVDVVVEKDGGVVDLEVSRVEVEACRIVELGACRVDVVSTKSEIVGCSTP